ncbi:protein CGI121 [Kwoniella heveanensis CBS 569]|nr:protein CGI121 [Kwoniella heveanensis CBS 569]
MESYDLASSFAFPAPYSHIHIALFKNVSNAPQIRKRLVEASVTKGPEGDQLRREVDYGFVEAGVLVSKEHLLTAILTTLLYAFPSPSSTSSSSSSAGLIAPALDSLSITSTQGSLPVSLESESKSTSRQPSASQTPTSISTFSSTPSSSTATATGISTPTVKPKTRTHNLHSELLLSLSPNNNITDSIRRHGISDTTRLLAVVRISGPEESAEDVYKGIKGVVEGELVSWDLFDRASSSVGVDAKSGANGNGNGDGDEKTGVQGVETDWARVDKIYKLSELNALKSSRSASEADVRAKKIAAVVSAVAIKNVI